MKNKAAIYLCLGLMMTYAPLFSQTENAPGSIGISASVQGDQFSFLVPIWLDEHFSLAPAVEIRSATAIGTEYGIGIVPRYYFDREKVAPFIGARAGAILYQPAKVNGINPTSTTDILVGGTFGADYFFDRHIALGLELQANFTISDENSLRFNNPGKTNFNTASAVFLSIYF